MQTNWSLQHSCSRPRCITEDLEFKNVTLQTPGLKFWRNFLKKIGRKQTIWCKPFFQVFSLWHAAASIGWESASYALCMRFYWFYSLWKFCFWPDWWVWKGTRDQWLHANDFEDGTRRASRGDLRWRWIYVILLALRGCKLETATGFGILVIQEIEKQLWNYRGLATPKCQKTDSAKSLRKEPEHHLLNGQVSRESGGEAVRAGCAGASPGV